MSSLPESFAISLKGYGRVKLLLSVDVEGQNGFCYPDGHSRNIDGDPKMPTVVISFSDCEVDSLDLGSEQLLQLLQHTTATTAATYSSIIKDYLQKELREQTCKWETKQLEEKILDCSTNPNLTKE